MNFNPTLHKLSNGVTVILDSFDSASSAASIAFLTGSRDEEPHQHGLTHFCEHMLLKGTPRFPRVGDSDNYLLKHAAFQNAITGDEQIVLYGSSVGKNLPVLIDVLCDNVNNAMFDEGAIERERGVILNELRNEQDNYRRIREERTQQKILSGGFPVYQGLGPEENIKSFTREQMLDWLGKRLSAKNCVVCVSGCIENQTALLQQLERELGHLPQIDVPVHPQVAKYKSGTVRHENKFVSTVSFDLWFPQLYEDKAATAKEYTCWNAYKKFMRHTLKQVLRNENGMIYYIDDVIMGPDGYQLAAFKLQTSPENLERLVALMARTIRDIYDGKIPLTEEFLDMHKGEMIYQDAMWRNDAKRRCNFLVNYWFDNGILYDYQKDIETLQSITVPDVIKYSRRAFNRPVSFVIDGHPNNVNLRQVWNQNFGVRPNRQLMVLSQAMQKTK